jgi:hypothetical protein
MRRQKAEGRRQKVKGYNPSLAFSFQLSAFGFVSFLHPKGHHEA